MRVKIFPWLGQEFVSLSWEGSGEGSVEDETRGLFTLFAEHLGELGLRLDDVSFSGATTGELNGGPDGRLGQIAAVTPTTKLVTITAGGSGSGNGTVAYSVAAYTGRPKNRNGTMTIAGLTFSIKQTR